MKRYRPLKTNILKWRVSPVTICVASIYGNHSILGASDRMLTAGDVQFQPPEPKIWPVTISIALLVSGEISLHTKMYKRLQDLVQEHIVENPTHWITVRWVADRYSHIYYQLRSEIAEREILSPLGLDKETFISRQKEMSQSFIDDIIFKLNRFSLPDIGAIVAGNDKDPDPLPSQANNNEGTPHLYIFDNGKLTCNDKVGFASVGAGYWHANSQFMFNGYTKNASEAFSLLNTYWAKKRAEVAPGVGEETDMFHIGPKLGSYQILPRNIIDDVHKIYKENTRKTEKLNRAMEDKVQSFLTELIQKNQQNQQAQSASQTSTDPGAPEK